MLARSAVRCRSHPARPAPSLEMTAVLEGDVFRRDCVAAEMVTPRRGAASQLAALAGAAA